MNCGIYKITNPKGKVYIGQSINIERRFKRYRQLHEGKAQKKLYNSFLKYTTECHLFEIIEVCDRVDLNRRERHWQLHYDSINTGLNLQLTEDEDNCRETSEETKLKIGSSLREYFSKIPQDKLNEIYGKSGKKLKGRVGTNKGKKASPETIEKISKSLKGRVVTESTREKIRAKMIGRDITWGVKISNSLKGKPNPKNRNKGNKVILQYNLDGSFIKEWSSITEASNTLKVSFNSISNALCGYCKTSAGFIWHYKTTNDDKQVK